MKKDLNDLKSTKEQLKRYQEPTPRLSEDYFDDLHDRIMAQIETRDMLSKSAVIRKKPWRWRSIFSGTAVLALTLLCRPLGFSNVAQASTQALLEQALANPLEMAQLVTYQTTDDFFVDVATENFDHLGMKAFNQIMGQQ